MQLSILIFDLWTSVKTYFTITLSSINRLLIINYLINK